MTGVEFQRNWAEKIDKTYSNYLSTTEENDLFKESLFVTITDVYNKLADQESYDDIYPLIRTNQIFKLNNNQIYVSPVPISNVVPVFSNTIISTPIPHNLAIGDFITIEGVQGITTTPAINGTFSVTNFLHSSTQFSITASFSAGAYTANTGQITHVDDGGATNIEKLVDDYWALLALKAKYLQALQLSITDATNTNPIRIKVDKRNNIKTGELINIVGINGNTNANGDRYVKKINTYQLDLYSDSDLTIPINGNGVFGGTGTINRIHYKSATPYFSSRQISEYSKPSVSSPQFDRAQNLLKILPNDKVCSELTLDYISVPPVDIDATNSTLDLENYFHYDFLIQVADTAAKLFFQRSKDFESMQADILTEQQK